MRHCSNISLGSSRGAAALEGPAAAGTLPSLASGSQPNIRTNLQQRTRLPDDPIPTEAAMIASMHHGLPSTSPGFQVPATVTAFEPKGGPIRGSTIPRAKSSNTTVSSGGMTSKGLINVGVAGNATVPLDRRATGQAVNMSGPGATSIANPVMRRLPPHNNPRATTTQQRVPVDFRSVFSSATLPVVVDHLTDPATTISHLRHILEIHQNPTYVPANQIPKPLSSSWFVIQYQLEVNPQFKQEFLRLLDLKMNLPTSPTEEASHGGKLLPVSSSSLYNHVLIESLDAMGVDNDDQVHGADIGHTGGASDVDINSIHGVQAVGNNVTNATQGTPAVVNNTVNAAPGAPAAAGNAQPARKVVAISARGRKVYEVMTAAEAIANLESRTARGEYLYGDGTGKYFTPRF
jgi:hypothetical protein